MCGRTYRNLGALMLRRELLWATTVQETASDVVADDGLPEPIARVDRMIPGREATPPGCREAVSNSGYCQICCQTQDSGD